MIEANFIEFSRRTYSMYSRVRGNIEQAMIEAEKCKKQTISSSCGGENAKFFRNAADYYQNRIHKKIYPLFHFVQEIKKRGD